MGCAGLRGLVLFILYIYITKSNFRGVTLLYPLSLNVSVRLKHNHKYHSQVSGDVRPFSLALDDLEGSYTPLTTVISQRTTLYPLYNPVSAETHLTLSTGDCL